MCQPYNQVSQILVTSCVPGLRVSHSEGGIPTRCVKTRVRAVALAYPTADAISFSELPLRNIVWATPSRQFVR